ncbi:MAG: hypothetical protein FVQ82_12035 [Planctomycetes bacterium]|nr:hypothetical protein [Planctomycetota bacterium]
MENASNQKTANKWLSIPIIATITRLLCRELTLQNEYLRQENKLLKSKIKKRIIFTDDEGSCRRGRLWKCLDRDSAYGRRDGWKERLSQTVETYPVLKGMKILCVKRAMPKAANKKTNKAPIALLKNLGFPTNHECNSSLKREIYNNEIGIIEAATGKYTTLYKPIGRRFVGNINLHWNADKFLFTQSDAANWKIFEMNIDGTGMRQVSRTPDDVDCFEPCYLPDGRIIFNSNAPYQCVPCWHGTKQKFVANLYIMNADGSGMRRLTFDQDHDFHPHHG